MLHCWLEPFDMSGFSEYEAYTNHCCFILNFRQHSSIECSSVVHMLNNFANEVVIIHEMLHSGKRKMFYIKLVYI